MPSPNLVEFIAELAQEVNGSTIDWSMLSVEESEAYKLMASQALENKALDDPMIARSVVTALLVENFTLNLRLMQLLKQRAA